MEDVQVVKVKMCNTAAFSPSEDDVDVSRYDYVLGVMRDLKESDSLMCWKGLCVGYTYYRHKNMHAYANGARC